MLISKENRRAIYKYLFKEGVLFAEKNTNLAKHPEIDVPNLQVMKVMQSFQSQELVTERYAWRHQYWFLTDKGIEYLREYLNLPTEVLPATLKKSTRVLEKGPVRPERGPRKFGDEGGRDGYRSERPGGFGRGAPVGGDKAGAPGAFKPSFGGRGAGAPPS
ncbi:hypothetical protein FOA52_012832 [Chlamydomonas sp. UWO 241]|nr:hypothetical protein FOA52_012832 [Chlamydomonas sp. UWO 241]